jgi:hypothetical protein
MVLRALQAVVKLPRLDDERLLLLSVEVKNVDTVLQKPARHEERQIYFKTNHQNFQSRRQFPGPDLKYMAFLIMKHERHLK